MKGLFNYFKTPKLFIQALYEKISEKASRAGQSVKSYLADEKNIHHISLVAYDLMPLTVKIGLRHEKFYEQFLKVFKFIRNQLFTYEEELNALNQNASAIKEKNLSNLTIQMNMILDNELRTQALSKNISKDELLQQYLDSGIKIAKKAAYSEKTVSEQVNANSNTSLRTVTIALDVDKQLNREALIHKINKHILLQGYVILGMQQAEDLQTIPTIKKIPRKTVAKKSPSKKVAAKKTVSKKVATKHIPKKA